MSDEKEEYVSKKVVAAEVLGHIKEKHEILIASTLSAVFIAGTAKINTTVTLIALGGLILYNGLKFMKNKGYENYLKDKYKM